MTCVFGRITIVIVIYMYNQDNSDCQITHFLVYALDILVIITEISIYSPWVFPKDITVCLEVSGYRPKCQGSRAEFLFGRCSDD